MGARKVTLPDEELKKLYFDDGLRMKDIAERLGCSPATICYRFQKMGVSARKNYDYPTTQKQRSAWVEIGKRSKGRTISAEQKAKLSEKMSGRRKRTDYEFGGHEKKRKDGYIRVYVPDHPNCTRDGFVMKHILVVERSIGRYLTDGECVHHINHIRDDNRIENLRLMTISDHASMHMKERRANRRNNLC